MRVMITQRVDKIEGHAETRDALDQAWATTLPQLFGCNAIILPIANAVARVEKTLQNLKPDAIVLSGGNDIGSALDRDATETILLEYAAQHTLPVLGVCRGMQFMQHHLGGALVKMDGHVNTEHAVYTADGFEFVVNSYHHFGIMKPATGLHALCTHQDGSIEAVTHADLPWLAVMWHPERALLPKANAWLAQQLKGWL